MNYVINIVLLLTATGLAALSFLGKAWDDSHIGGRRKLTWHGAASIALWLVALGFGVWKEERTEASDKQKHLETVQAQAELLSAQRQFDKRQANEQVELSKAEVQTAKANGALDEMHAQMGHVQHNLDQASANAAQQSVGSLITSLANTHQKVREVGVILPFTAHAVRSTSFARAFLPSFSSAACTDLVGAAVSLNPSDEDPRIFTYAPSYKKPESEQDEDIPQDSELDILPKGDAHDKFAAINSYLNQSSWNSATYIAAFRSGPAESSAATLFSALTLTDSEPLTLESYWSAVSAPRSPSSSGVEAHKATKTMPATCSSQIGGYFATAFDRAALTVVLDQQENETIIFPLRRLPPVRSSDGNWSVSFRISGPSRIFAQQGNSALFFPNKR